MADEQNKNKTFAWGSHVVSAGSNILNTITNQVLAEHNREANFKWNELAADKADERHRKQFDDMYSYAAQVEQAKKAGLSPSILFGSGASGQGGASTPQSQSVQGLQAPYAGIIDPLQAAQIENIKADTESKKIDNEYKQPLLDSQIALNLQQAGYYKAAARLSAASADMEELQVMLLEDSYDWQLNTIHAKMREAAANADKAAGEARSAIVQADIDETTFDAKYQQVYADLQKTITDEALARSGIKLNNAQIKLIGTEIWKMKEDNKIDRARLSYDKQYREQEINHWLRSDRAEAEKINQVWKQIAIDEQQMQLEFISDMIGYAFSFTNTSTIAKSKEKTTQMTIDQKNKSKTSHQQNYKINKKGEKVVTGGKYTKTQ